MSSRDIIVGTDVTLIQNEKGQYIVNKIGGYPYILNPKSRTHEIIRILDIRGLAQQRRYECANDIINTLEQKLTKIEKSGIYKFFHAIGMLG